MTTQVTEYVSEESKAQAQLFKSMTNNVLSADISLVEIEYEVHKVKDEIYEVFWFVRDDEWNFYSLSDGVDKLPHLIKMRDKFLFQKDTELTQEIEYGTQDYDAKFWSTHAESEITPEVWEELRIKPETVLKHAHEIYDDPVEACSRICHFIVECTVDQYKQRLCKDTNGQMIPA